MKAAVISALLLLGAAAAAGEEEAWGARLKLVSENAVIAPGQPFTLGIEVHHREGFHSYWKNPGRVGFATRIEWKLPEGFEAGPIVWPTPEMVDMAGHMAHGYHRDVLLMVTITPPREIDLETVTLDARIAWMACSDACHPGDEPFSITLPVGPSPKRDPELAARFDRARAAQPTPLKGWSAELLSETDAPVIRLKLTRTGDDSPLLQKPYFFSTDGQVADGAPEVETPSEDVVICTFARAEHGPEKAPGLPGLIAYGPDGDRHFGSIAP